jgi:hypothetical protein
MKKKKKKKKKEKQKSITVISHAEGHWTRKSAPRFCTVYKVVGLEGAEFLNRQCI